jgi:predicted RNA-binding protein YlxR (DUF448 family)
MSGRKKHVPQRTCVGCRETHSKRALIRIVRTGDRVEIDLTSKSPGRGAYLHDRQSCWEAGLKGSLATALRAEIGPDDHAELVNYMQSLTDREEG